MLSGYPTLGGVLSRNKWHIFFEETSQKRGETEERAGPAIEMEAEDRLSLG